MRGNFSVKILLSGTKKTFAGLLYTPIDVLRFSHLIQPFSGTPREHLDQLLLDLTHGADTLVRGVGRLPTVSKNAYSAIEAGPQTSDAIVSFMKLGVFAGPLDQPPLIASWP